ncbi:hypothetical protein ScPMuIL_006263 [Solemya velum]
MTSGGTIMQRPEKAVELGREDSQCNLGIKGHSIVTPRLSERVDATFLEPAEEMSPPSIGLFRESTGSSSEHGEPIGTIEMPEEGVAVLQTVMNMNKMLEHQIDALRLRIDVESKHHGEEKDRILRDKKDKIESKEEQIKELREVVTKKEEKIQTLAKEKESQDIAIRTKLEEIGDLRHLVKQTEEYAERLQKRFSKLKDERDHLETDGVYKNQNDHIGKLKQEISHLREKVGSMEQELSRARNIMETQNQKMRLLEAEKNNIHSKFREELDKATRVMRQEVERMREVMKMHYEEMRDLRQQNQEISTDVKDIKELLMKTHTPRPQASVPKMSSQFLDVNQFPAAQPRTPGTSPRRGMSDTRTGSSLSRTQTKVPTRASTGTIGQPKVTGQAAFPLIPNEKEKRWVPNGGKKAATSYVSPYKGHLRK